jgi:hypothetical protein
MLKQDCGVYPCAPHYTDTAVVIESDVKLYLNKKFDTDLGSVRADYIRLNRTLQHLNFVGVSQRSKIMWLSLWGSVFCFANYDALAHSSITLIARHLSAQTALCNF